MTLKPTASWVASGAGSDRKKVTMNGNLTFNYYQLECKVAHSLIVDVASLDIFEQSISELIAEAANDGPGFSWQEVRQQIKDRHPWLR